MNQHVRGLFRLCVSAGALLIGAWSAQAQEAGTIAGRVVDASSNAPVPTAQIQVVGSTRGAVTGDDGRFRIAGIAAGEYQLRVLRLGYQGSSRTVTVTAGGTTDVEFTVVPAAVSLEEVVTTATGERERKREIGSAVSTVQPQEHQLASAQNVSQLLTGKIPGVDVAQAGGTIGSASRTRIRGANSLSLTNEPLIVVDGIRFNNNIGNSGTTGSTTIGVGGQVPSRFNDINPEDVETYEVLKGPAAAAQYGTAAANGVIQITTKHGHSGRARWTTFAEGGTIRDVTDYPPNYAQVANERNANGSRIICSLDSQTRGLCTPNPDSLVVFSPLGSYSPFINGHRGAYGASVAGGSDQITYYLGGNFDREQGVFEISQDQRASGRANLSIQMRDNWNIQIGTSYLAAHTRLPQNDHNVLGIVSSGLLGSAFDDNPPTPPCVGAASSALPGAHGYLSGQCPQAIYAINTHQDAQR